MRVVIAGGGTGGHLFPAIALAEELIKRDPDTEVTFMGTEHGIEAKVIPREGYSIRFIPAEGFVGRSLYRRVHSAFYFIRGIRESYNYLRSARPDIVVGSGGYASFTPVVSARLLSIPTLIMEQNSVPGKANRLLGHIVKAVCITYQDSRAYFPSHKVHLTGNPIRERLLKGSRASALRLFSLRDGLFTVFVFGGSSGASSINKAMVDSLQYLIDLKEELQFLHQTGERDYGFVKNSYRSYGFSGTVTPFIYQMPEAYAVADIVISRAGATTLSEICATGKPSILIPYPYAAANHQETNALKLQRLGAGIMIKDSELTGKRLSEEIKRLCREPELRRGISVKAFGFGRPDAVKRIADIILSLISVQSKGERALRCLNSTE